MNPKPITLRSCLERALARVVIITVVAAVAFGAPALLGSLIHLNNTQDAVMVDHGPSTLTPVKGSAEHMVAAHDCWTDGESHHTLPGHAVVTYRTVTRYIGAERDAHLMKLAFDEVPKALGGAGIDHPQMTVHAFCD